MIERIKTALQSENRAVSPVIGVILMVAITVILAAVIGSFVLDFSSNLNQEKTLSISPQDSAANYQPNSAGDEQVLEFSHDGGSKLDMSKYKIVIRKQSNNQFVIAWDGSNGNWYNDAGLTTESSLWSGAVNGQSFQAGFTFQSGDKIIISLDDTADTAKQLSDGTTYVVSIVNKESGSTIAKGSFTVQ